MVASKGDPSFSKPGSGKPAVSLFAYFFSVRIEHVILYKYWITVEKLIFH
jgi:hypothetical protein